MRGRVIGGRYELRRKVGEGGMGLVWEAFDRALKRAVAIKLMSSDGHRDTSFRARFEREALALARIQSEHIVQVFDYGVDEDAPHIVMELLTGEDLESRLRREHKLSPALVVELMRQASSGLAAAAVHGIVHRDLKPANLFLVGGAAREQVKLLDFGVARMLASDQDPTLTSTGSFLGTPCYMSPEQIRGHEPNPQSDLWSMGVIAYRALTGQVPFSGKNLGSLIVSICTDPYSPARAVVPELPATLDAFFERALAKDPHVRFQSAAEFVEALTQACKATATITILSVDDEPDMAGLFKLHFREQIRSAAYRFLFAENGKQALEVLRHNPDVDVILSDIKMPVMDGLTLLEHIPELSPSARAVMVSAFGEMGNIRRAMNAGAFDFVVKPIDFSDLDATIKKAARAVAEHREMASSTDENRVLRQLVSSVLARRFASLPLDVALAAEPLEGTIMAIHIGRPGDDRAQDLARALNANYEVIVSLVHQHGGMVDSITGDELVCVWSGRAHVERALEACVELHKDLVRLTSHAGEGSPYARGLAVGIATGQLLMTCVGSNAGRRFNYTVVGPAHEKALALVRLARPGEVLVHAAVVDAAHPRHSIAPLDRPAGRVSEGVYVLTDAHGSLEPLSSAPTMLEPTAVGELRVGLSAHDEAT